MPKKTIVLGLIAVVVFVTLFVMVLRFANPPQAAAAWPQQVLEAGANEIAFVDSAECTSCHTEQAAAWGGSHHDQAMQPANEATVLGDFSDVTFVDFGVTSRFFKRDDAYVINTQGADGEYADFAVKYTFGVEPLQQYLVEFPDGKLQAFTIAWDTKRGEWFNLQPNELIAPDDELHWTRRHFTWNSSCAECHSADLQLNYTLESNSYETSWANVNVSCQACHGPGEAHVAWAQGGGRADDNGLAVNYSGIDAPDLVESCARCHSRRYAISPHDQHGEAFLDNFMPELLHEGLYHADGQILDEVYVYGSFTQSKMYQRGVSCSDCHDVHSLELLAPGNDLCTACHQANPPLDRFPTLQSKVYDSAEHHHHDPASDGAQCVSCHMPSQNYMVVDPRRDHSLRIPRPDLSVTLGTPNACTQCHSDQEPAWAVDAMTAWYGDGWQQPHYGEVLAAGRTGAPDSADDLISLANSVAMPTLVRATALDLLRSQGDVGIETWQGHLSAEDALLRAISARGLAVLPVQERINTLIPLLNDPVRAVRVETVNALSTIPLSSFGDAERAAYATALTEYQSAQIALPDHPEGYANLGSLYVALGEIGRAETSYQIAIDRDEHFYPAYRNLAILLQQQGKSAEAEQTLRDAIAVNPNDATLHHSLASTLAEQARLNEALNAIEKAIELDDQNARVYHDYALLLQEVERFNSAEVALLQALNLVPNDPDALYALITLYLSQEKFDAAILYAEQLTRFYPDVPEFQSFLQSLLTQP